MPSGIRSEAIDAAERAMFAALAEAVSNNPTRTRDDFSDLMTASFGEGRLSLRALSDDLGFSFTTAFRWRGGRSAPHPSLWPRIEAWIAGQASQRALTARHRA